MDQRSIRRAWITFILASNVVLMGYLYYYQNPGGIILGLPETWVVLFVLMLGVIIVNSYFAWLYLSKPDLRQVFGASGGQGGEP